MRPVWAGWALACRAVAPAGEGTTPRAGSGTASSGTASSATVKTAALKFNLGKRGRPMTYHLLSASTNVW
jgi:hypothetical protein